MTADESFFKEAQSLINKFVNKKLITSSNKYVPVNLGGTGTPHLYTSYLASKLSLAHRLVQCERNGTDFKLGKF